MSRFVQWLNKIPVKVFLIVYLVLRFSLPLLSLSLNIEKINPIDFAFSILITLSFILLAVRFLYYLKSKRSRWYNIFRFILGGSILLLSAGLFIDLDMLLGLRGFLALSGILLLVIFFACLLIRSIIKSINKKLNRENDMVDYLQEQNSGERIAAYLSEGREIEFTYDNVRYLFIPENGRFFFKRIVSIDPYEYEVLTESEDALVCVDASAVNGKKISGLWPDVEDISVY